MKRALGTCYYPEHWPEELWPDDAKRMRAAGISHVRIGEFAWARLEPVSGKLNFDWLDRAIDVLAAQDLKIVMGTPTATPPRWMLDKHPDMLALDAEGRPRKFGSRRHYCFSHEGYLQESRRVTELMGERYGSDPRIVAWQIDNEYGCHDTTLSYSMAAQSRFRSWLAQKYQSPDALNRAWGNVFWSMDYAEFDEVDLPNMTVTEPNPAHVLAFRRFASDEVVRFNAVMAIALRKWTDAPLLHNYMGRILEFDHFAMGADLDIASWDSYPLGFLMDRIDCDAETRAHYMRQGHPDFQAFHHDLYRTVGQGRWWVMEQQPGPVNWAPWNPAPLPGMVRLWSWEAFAHGAEVVSYFRWRQPPFAQEQMHTALLRTDNCDAAALDEVKKVARDIETMPEAGTANANVAIIFDYVSQWAWEIQPQGQDFDYFNLVFSAYSALRRAGLSIDILPSDTQDLSNYKLVLVPGLMTLGDDLKAAISAFDGQVILGPRFNTRNADFRIPQKLPPDCDLIDTQIVTTETLPPGAAIAAQGDGSIIRWWEHLQGSAPVQIATPDGQAILVGDRIKYLAGWPDDALWDRLLATALSDAGIDRLQLPKGLRVRDTATHRFIFNYGADVARFEGRAIEAGDFIHEPLTTKE